MCRLTWNLILSQIYPSPQTDSPSWRSHDAAPSVRCHPAPTSPLWCVMVHSKVVSQLMSQSNCSSKGVIRVVLRGGGRQNKINRKNDKAGVIINCIYTCLQINQCLHSMAPHKALTRFPKSNYLYFQATKPNYAPAFASEKGLGAITLLLPSLDCILNISTCAFVFF